MSSCAWCGKELAARNASGVCYLCARRGRSARKCGCGCGRLLSARNRLGVARCCFMRIALTATAERLRARGLP